MCIRDSYYLMWSVYEAGKAIQATLKKDINMAPRQRMQIALPYNRAAFKKDAEYFVKVQFILKDKMPWADKDFVMAEEQVLVKEHLRLQPGCGLYGERCSVPVHPDLEWPGRAGAQDCFPGPHWCSHEV